MQSVLKTQNIQWSSFTEDIALLQQQSKVFDTFQTFDLDASQTSKKSKKQKTISKKRTRIMKDNSGWTLDERSKYFKALIRFNIQKTNIGLSWTFWKPQKIFNYIESKIKTKTSAQIKTFDQRMKKKHLKGPNHLDLIPTALFQLQKVKDEDQQAKQLIQAHKRLQKVGSPYMEVIKNKTKQLYQIDNLIQNFKKSMSMYEPRGQAEDIFIDQE